MQDPSYRVQVPFDQCIDEDLLLPFVDSPSPHASENVNTATVEDQVNEISTSTFLTEQIGDTQISEIVNLLRSSSLIGSQKIQDYFIGPFSVVGKNSDVNCTMQILKNPHAELFKIHINRLKLAPSRAAHLVQAMQSRA
ncbi:hypothetical protein JTE90_006764 [Oedothorax gibbosus]|uniref:Uncharacterized protein n=1 Tax=Oedothorax gibbosus TaxID=931172 RepID=A0AAV6UL42_9ARAC|nr:hypothetical protein JTE90_006764 [Oedothorax gibbosus]